HADGELRVPRLGAEPEGLRDPFPMILPLTSQTTRPDRAGGPSVAADSATTTAQPISGEFLNRELSWLQFNRRVLHEAMDPRTPLLERVRFLEIFTSNLDEFFMKRVGGLRRQLNAGVVSHTPDGLTPHQQLAAIRKAVVPMLQHQAEIFAKKVRPALAQ